MNTTIKGSTEPRLWTRREGVATRGGDFQQFTRDVLGIGLYPWQEWVTNQALQIDSDGHYIYDTVVIIVARQNGKTLLASSLAAWWLYEDLRNEPDRLHDARVLGVAQNLAIAEKPWGKVADWFDPRESNDRQIPLLSSDVEHVFRGNGNKTIKLDSGITYSARDGYNSRGESASRVLLDELREQTNFKAWNSVSQVTKTYRDGQVWAITSGGTGDAVVLNQLREAALAEIDDPDASIALFEWSAPEGCAVDDEQAILAANPSCGYMPSLTLDRLKKDAKKYTEHDYRLEVLSQTLTVSASMLFSTAQVDAACYEGEGLPFTPVCKVAVAVAVDGMKYSNVLSVAFSERGEWLAGLAADWRAGGLWAGSLLASQAEDVERVSFNVAVNNVPQVTSDKADAARLYQNVLDGTGKIVNDEAMREALIQIGGHITEDGTVKLENVPPVAGALLSALHWYSEQARDNFRARYRSAYEEHGLITV